MGIIYGISLGVTEWTELVSFGGSVDGSKYDMGISPLSILVN